MKQNMFTNPISLTQDEKKKKKKNTQPKQKAFFVLHGSI